jgi:hypothetical protein
MTDLMLFRQRWAVLYVRRRRSGQERLVMDHELRPAESGEPASDPALGDDPPGVNRFDEVCMIDLVLIGVRLRKGGDRILELFA